ncbi:hypothetical protein [Nonomuraea sp. NPDC050643]|uniref:hypothetical protein n=1 Tax=Nonomuraea sp. NPDC050643 TaxID=3155660 RepID=UPI0033E66998
MTNPFPAVDQANLRTLTDSGIAHYRKLNERDEKELDLLRTERARLSAEISSVDEVMADLHETIGRRQAKMRGDVIAQLPAGSVPPLEGGPGDPRVHQGTWDGFAASPDLSPDPDANLERLSELHDAQNAREGAR